MQGEQERERLRAGSGSLLTQDQSAAPDAVAVWRRTILERVLWIALCCMVLACGLLLLRGAAGRSLLFTIVPGLLIVVAVIAWRRGATGVRAAVFIAGFLVVVLSTGINRGLSVPNPYVGGLFVSVLAALVLPRAGAWLTVAACAGTCIVVAAVHVGQPPIRDSVSDASDLMNWIRVVLIFTALCVGTTFAVQFMVSRLEQALLRSQELNAALETETATRLEAARRQHELETQMQQAQKLESLGRLATGIAHDFNNMLVVIAGNAEAATEPDASDEEREAARRDLRSALDQASALTRQLLAFSRTRASELDCVDVRGRLSDVLAMLRRVLPSSIRVVAEFDDELPAVRGPSTLVDQTVMNLAINARDAMPDGGTLTIGAKLVQRMDPAAREGRDKQYVALSVDDTGVGMDEQTRQRAFDPFFTTKPAGQGTGFGLSVVHGLAQQSGGFVEVVSQPGQGTSVRVFLPAEPAKPNVVPTARVLTQLGVGEGRLVLVVEDDERIRRLIVRYLEQAGYRTLVAEDGQAGFELVKQRGAELTLVISDTAMPGLDGRTLFDEIQKARPELPVLICSGHATEFFEHASFAGSQQMLLAKPFTREQLLGAASTLCGSKGAAAPTVADTAPLAPS